LKLKNSTPLIVMTSKNQRLFRNSWLLSIFLIGSWCMAASARTLKTANFSVEIIPNCEEGNVVCNDVTYVFTELETTMAITRKGRTVHHLCADRVTPCQFLGYEFLDKRYEEPEDQPELITHTDFAFTPYRYFISESGKLEIYRYKQLITSEQGTWQD
jgi:hypothetical protein